MKLLLTMLLAVALLVSPAFAFNWTFYDFGDNYFDEHNNTHDLPMGYPNAYPDQPSPGGGGEGGEMYDIEGLNFAYDDTYMYLSLTNSFGWESYSTYFDDTFATGDLFFGFDGAMTTYAIDFSNGELLQVDAYSLITDKPGTYYDNTPIRDAIGAYQVTQGTFLGNASNVGPDGFNFTDIVEPNPLVPGNGDTHIMEIRFALADLGVNLTDHQTINFHNTIECGNDLLEKEFNIVPEPTTMILLGLGLVGVGARLRRRK